MVRKDVRGILGQSALVAAFVVFVLAAFPAAAGATVTSHTMAVKVTPTSQDYTSFGGVSLRIDFDTAYSSLPGPPGLREAVIHLDDDFIFDTSGLAQCDPSQLNAKPTAAAMAACPGAQVGSGSAALNNGVIPGVVTVFNGTPESGKPRLLLHIDLDSGALIVVLAGSISPSSLGGDFGSQLDFQFPNFGGLEFTHLDFTLDNLMPLPGHHYLAARCHDLDQTWNFASTFSFLYGGNQVFSPSSSQACQRPPTGLRAAAIKRCKKRYPPGKKRQKCIKRAVQQQPV